MFDHAILAYETFATNITGERLLACVQAHVPPQVRLVVELLGANLAFVGLVSLMFGHVLLIENLDWESFATLSTFERFLTIMEALVVLFQVAQAIKHFIALDTTVFTRGCGTGGVGGPTRGDTLS